MSRAECGDIRTYGFQPTGSAEPLSDIDSRSPSDALEMLCKPGAGLRPALLTKQVEERRVRQHLGVGPLERRDLADIDHVKAHLLQAALVPVTAPGGASIGDMCCSRLRSTDGNGSDASTSPVPGRPHLEWTVLCSQAEITIGGEDGQVMVNAELRKQGVDGAQLHARAAADIAK